MSWNCQGQVGRMVPVTFPLGVPMSTTSASSAMIKSADMTINAVLSAMCIFVVRGVINLAYVLSY